MADQKEMKRRLKVLMQKPENQVCSDCPERQPRWASLIVPPPGSPPGSTKVGAFCCLECSGSHRRLGVHISFVRSVNLDSWKEAEVLAMENGGNKKVNAIWEANLQRAGGRKPSTGADLTTRERYIRDKYERRRFYDPQALIEYQSNEPSFDDIGSRNQGGDFANFGPPPDNQVSDAAKLRAEKKKKKGGPQSKSVSAPSRTKSTGSNEGAADRRRQKTQQKLEAQPVVDLLDLGGGSNNNSTPISDGTGSAGAPFADFFSAEATNGVAGTTTGPTMETPKRRSSRDGSRSRSKTRDQIRTKSKTPDREQTRKNQQQDILNMYNTPTPVQPAGMNPSASGMNNQMNMMAMMQQMQQMNMNPAQNQQMGGMADASGGKHNARLAMHQNLMMQQMRAQMQQQQQNMHQMQRMMQQQGGVGMNPQMAAGMNPQMAAGMNPQMMQGAGMNPQIMQAMMQANQGGMPNLQMNMNPNMMAPNQNFMMGMNPTMVQSQQNRANVNQMGGFSLNRNNANDQVQEKDDPFSQFGMNAFR